MKIIISPAKKMKTDTESLEYCNLPPLINDTEVLLSYLKGLSYEEAKLVWKCNDTIANQNYERIQNMNLYHNLTPAILSYEGIQYQYMAPGVFSKDEFAYVEKHLRIISGFYGVLRPFDGVTPYRLEMQAKLKGDNLTSLYEFWNRKLAEHIFSESNCIINLASKEYSKCISDYLDDRVRFITCVFGEKIGKKVVEKGTQVKMARGEMVRFMAEKQIESIEDIKSFDRLNYVFADELSNENTYVFVKGYEEEMMQDWFMKTRDVNASTSGVEKISKALKLIKEELDFSGYEHSMRVANYAINSPILKVNIENLDIDILHVVALLHDVIEDTNMNYEDISKKIELPIDFIKDTIGALTKEKNENYNDYIKRLRDSGNLYAWIVKLADMKDHLAQTETLTDRLKEKYLNALPFLL